MAKAQRIDKLERERETLEGEYRDALVEALHECANGRWGLFEQNKGLLPAALEARLTPQSVTRLAELTEQISAVRQTLGYVEPFALSAQLDAYRKQRGAHKLGEQRLATQFLQDLTISD